jgi:RIP metalloprotease RseP
MDASWLTLAKIESGFLAFVIFILGFGFLIFIHEMGHFLAAKYVGIRATQFAIGFGNAIVAFRKGMGFRYGTTEIEFHTRINERYDKLSEEDPETYPPRDPAEPLNELLQEKLGNELGYGETEYRLNWIPFGGYVKMVGQEDLDPTATSDNPRAFNQKPFWPRALVICAGVVMNSICAAIFFVLAFMEGVYFPPARIGLISANSPAATASAEGHKDRILQPGDVVVEINGERGDFDFTDIRMAAALDAKQSENEHLGEPIDFVVRAADEQGAEYRYRIAPRKGPGQPFFSLGITQPQNLWIGALNKPFKQSLGIDLHETSVESRLAGDDKAGKASAEAELAAVAKLFPNADSDGNGKLTLAEFKTYKTDVLSQMRLAAVNGQFIHPTDHWQFDRLLQRNGPKPLTLTFLSDKKAYSAAMEANGGRLPKDVSAMDKNAETPRFKVTVTPRTTLSILDLSKLKDERPHDLQHLLGLVAPVRIGHVVGGTAAENKLEEDDLIAELNGSAYPDWFAVVDIIQGSRNKVLNFKVWRVVDGTEKLVEVSVTPKARGLFGMGMPRLGVGPRIAEDTNLIAHIREDSPFAKIKADGSVRLLKINDTPITRFTDIRNAIHASDGTLKVTYKIDLGGGREETATIKISNEQKLAVAGLSWAADLPSFQAHTELQDAGGSAWVAIQLGVHKTQLFLMQTYVTLARLIQGSVGLDQMKGPVGITDIGYQITQKGIPYLLFMLALISINLAVINFLPLPIVDGGLFVLLCIETIRGKPVPARIAQSVNLVGLILIGSIFLYITYNDIASILLR